jgi:hypothetical protein
MYNVPAGRHMGGAGASGAVPAGVLGSELGWAVSGVPTQDELVRAYCVAARRAYPLPDWNFFRAFWYFKYAVIFQGIAARSAKGNASSANAAAVGVLAPQLASMAKECMMEADTASGAETGAGGVQSAVGVGQRHAKL